MFPLKFKVFRITEILSSTFWHLSWQWILPSQPQNLSGEGLSHAREFFFRFSH